VERDATPERPRIGVVVGEGHPMRRGLLRFVLEGEGFLVLGDAATTVELVQALSVHRPDAVVLDDAIGTTAIVITREMRPEAKIVLVWPPEVHPINGDATVDPSQVLRELAPAVERACGIPDPVPATASVRKLPVRTAASGHHHPSAGMADILPGPGVARGGVRDQEVIVVDRDPAPILILPVSTEIEREPQP
jgi:CheY-like chemotaxis protein